MPAGLLELLQRRVALEALGESGSSFRAESVFRETASMGAETAAEACQGALTQKRTLFGSGALEVGNHRLFEDCSKRRGALVSDVIPPETVNKGWRGDSERVSMSMGADTKANTQGQRT